MFNSGDNVWSIKSNHVDNSDNCGLLRSVCRALYHVFLNMSSLKEEYYHTHFTDSDIEAL